MTRPSLRFALPAFLAAMSLLPGCGTLPSNPMVARNFSESTAERDAKKPLLFVSDLISGDVYILTVPDLVLEKTLTGFVSVGGLCGDASGNVWVTDGSVDRISKYSREGRLLGTLSVPGGSSACAVDGLSGDLAVSNAGYGSVPGAVYVFPNASGTPRSVQNPDVQSYGYLGYDPQGNLFFGGLEPVFSDFNLIVSEAYAGSGTAHTVNIAGAPSKFASGMVQWDQARHRLLVGDVYCHNADATCIYEIAISGSTGTIIRRVPLKNVAGGPACAVWQAVLLPGTQRVAGGDSEAGCGSTPSSVGIWTLRHGGRPRNSNAGITSLSLPFGAALSVGKP